MRTHEGYTIMNLSGILTLFNLREIKTCWVYRTIMWLNETIQPHGQLRTLHTKWQSVS